MADKRELIIAACTKSREHGLADSRERLILELVEEIATLKVFKECHDQDYCAGLCWDFTKNQQRTS